MAKFPLKNEGTLNERWSYYSEYFNQYLKHPFPIANLRLRAPDQFVSLAPLKGLQQQSKCMVIWLASRVFRALLFVSTLSRFKQITKAHIIFNWRAVYRKLTVTTRESVFTSLEKVQNLSLITAEANSCYCEHSQERFWLSRSYLEFNAQMEFNFAWPGFLPCLGCPQCLASAAYAQGKLFRATVKNLELIS